MNANKGIISQPIFSNRNHQSFIAVIEQMSYTLKVERI